MNPLIKKMIRWAAWHALVGVMIVATGLTIAWLWGSCIPPRPLLEWISAFAFFVVVMGATGAIAACLHEFVDTMEVLRSWKDR
jgi:hypothetical protein